MVASLASLTDGAGHVLAGAVTLLTRRPADKPMHPRGEVLTARLRRTGAPGEPTGAAFLDEAGDDEVLVRFSRSVGLPAPWPDVNGLAVRVPTADAAAPHADVLLSGTGHGRLTRYLLAPSRRDRGRFLGTLVPYGSPVGAVHLGARALDDTTWELAWARAGSGWTRFATLELDDAPGRDLAISFDAVTVAPPGLEVYGWYRRLRGPSYAAARRARGTTSPYDAPAGSVAQSSTTTSSPRRTARLTRSRSLRP